jgi:hypothetical protein
MEKEEERDRERDRERLKETDRDRQIDRDRADNKNCWQIEICYKFFIKIIFVLTL